MSSKLIILIIAIQACVAAASLYKGDKTTFLVFIGFVISNIGLALQAK